MKHLSYKIAVNALVTSVILSSVNATGAFTETYQPVVSSTAKTAVTLNDPQAIIASLRAGEAQLEQALVAGAHAQEEAIRLKAEYEALKSKATRLKFQNVVLEAQQQEHRAEKQSTWQRFKNWVSKLDVTKVVTTVVSGIVTLIGTLLLILL